MLDARFGASLAAFTLGISLASSARAATAPGASCLLTNDGLDVASARSGARIICEELRDNGVILAPEGSATADAYRVRFERLGQHVIVTVSYEAPPGTVTRRRRMVLNGPEELVVAGPRVANAIVNDVPLEDTAKVDTLVGEETRRYKKKSGEFLWGAGILGMSVPTARVVAAPGIELFAMYERPTYGVGMSLRGTFDNDADNSAQFGSVGVGGRYFFGEGDIAAFAGGGISISELDIELGRYGRDDVKQASGSGSGAYAEGGVEFLRLQSSRLILGLRIDTPFYEVHTYSYYAYGYSPDARSTQGEEYHVPATLSATYAW